MSTLAVKDYIQSTIIPGITIPPQVTLYNTIKGYRQQPDQQKLGSTIAVVIVTEDGTERRFTMPRGGASKLVTYEIGLIILGTQKSGQDGADQFDVITWTIAKAFRTANTSVQITDPLTSETSWLHMIGENIKWRGELPELLAAALGAGEKLFAKTMHVEVKEIVSG